MSGIREMYLDARLNPFWDEIIALRKEKAAGKQVNFAPVIKEMRAAIVGLTLKDAAEIAKNDNGEFPDPRNTQKDDKDKLIVLQRNLLEQAQTIDNLRMQLAIANAVNDTLRETLDRIIEAAIKGRKTI